ncbi:MAG: hypothetical protein UU65_C0002G0127 [candidate division CPR2 bacterium GW2011_GWC1_41_48]|uniref:Uncharacterized protein n=1 Tax=candidate division CPR2 bacterium GW2011_GWC1_41_48 TaxID=1618344 RepID=A0A0G0W8M8_UNCC2|nr:MAG: hypothetical protein UT47_C0002G0177 [candidate division CPR2 bacterium GW2011_GWC2_39_35]KKR27270.1 MAG: hypothetical protein UT59_C0063G0002 [candidate division CPR2 bacterium GW2011_GWD1_39_7]KKR28315.1 MAG: hypothetical protein UT60_C0023G0023 [candidate division CPR2 bacterium GW2011_GWD2_39_7]KKS09349.1 MAG: hypothetical protein UU65_C0002G0127 [candidate division CPR2 bacterium GW2011_GWC1_41_48]
MKSNNSMDIPNIIMETRKMKGYSGLGLGPVEETEFYLQGSLMEPIDALYSYRKWLGEEIDADGTLGVGDLNAEILNAIYEIESIFEIDFCDCSITIHMEGDYGQDELTNDIRRQIHDKVIDILIEKAYRTEDEVSVETSLGALRPTTAWYVKNIFENMTRTAQTARPSLPKDRKWSEEDIQTVVRLFGGALRAELSGDSIWNRSDLQQVAKKYVNEVFLPKPE